MRRPVFSLLLVAGTLCASVALAQSTPTPPPNPCRADVARLCPNAQGHKDVRACMQQNADQVSAECKAHIEARRAKFQAAREACEPDVAKFCSDVQPGGGRVIACLKQHAAEISDACRAQWPSKPGNNL